MSLQQLIVCPCGHSLEEHGAEGCSHAARTHPCACAHSPTSVVDVAIDAEREAYRRQWLDAAR